MSILTAPIQNQFLLVMGEFVVNEMMGGPTIVTSDCQNNFSLMGRYHCIFRIEMHNSQQHMLQDAEWR